jgi:hypothetical protein
MDVLSTRVLTGLSRLGKLPEFNPSPTVMTSMARPDRDRFRLEMLSRRFLRTSWEKRYLGDDLLMSFVALAVFLWG